MQHIQADVTDIVSLSSFVYKIALRPKVPIVFKAGQYLHVIMGDDDKRPFSIANSPEQKNYLELHIGASADNPYAYEVLTKAREAKLLTLEVALGEAFVRNNDKKIVLIAGGTGYSYTRSILQYTLEKQPKRNVTLYWGAKNQDDLYEHKHLKSLARSHAHFNYIPVVENAENWNGKIGLVHQAALDDIDDLSAVEVYVAGRFEMASVIRDDFTAKGLAADQLFGDAYAFI